MSDKSLKIMEAVAKILSAGKKVDNKHGLDIEEVAEPKAPKPMKLEIEPVDEDEMEDEMPQPAQLGKKKLIKK